MEVCVTTLSGESYQLQADPTWASRDLKMAVKTASGIRLREQRLVCGTQELPEDPPGLSMPIERDDERDPHSSPS